MTLFWHYVTVNTRHSKYGGCTGRVIQESAWHITRIEIETEGKVEKVWIENGCLEPLQAPIPVREQLL